VHANKNSVYSDLTLSTPRGPRDADMKVMTEGKNLFPTCGVACDIPAEIKKFIIAIRSIGGRIA
jgi:hypothetical protein